MDETALWFARVGNTTANVTGAQDIPLKSTGNVKMQVSVCLAGKSNGTTAKMKPFVIFSNC